MEKSEAVKELFADTADDGYIAAGYYANGARNFYLKDDVPVTDTSVLSGKKNSFNAKFNINGYD